MGWNGPENLGGQLGSGSLSAVSWGPNRLDVFGRGTDGTLQHWWYDNGAGNFYGPPDSLGGQLQPGGLSAVSWKSGRLDVFGTGADGTLLHWWYGDGSSGNFFTKSPESLGGELNPATTLSAVSWGDHRLDVFGTGADGTLKYWWYDNGAGNFYGPPDSLGGQLQPGSMSAVSWGRGRLDVFGTNPLGLLLHWYNDNGAWNSVPERPESLGGELAVDRTAATAVSAVTWGGKRLDVFGIGSDAINRTLQHWWYDNGAGNFSSKQPEPLGVAGELSGYGDLSAVSQDFGLLDIFACGPLSQPAHWAYGSGPENFYGAPEILPASQFDGVYGLSVVSWGPGRLDVFGIGYPGGTLQHWWCS